MKTSRANKGENERLISEMADYIEENGDNCTEATMLCRYTQNEVATCFPAARDEAHRRRLQRAA
ncbi:hypothetical protein [Agrobacterium tumefaciens]|uniref:hypothetical protein n=1 Tax=Agrobacterium tumefaciens TaxID=358 RepID=UPI001CBCE1D3|nr:hypothetical protein [Agrobacterium tumefaciens]MDP9875613.1 hypothetical protein [Agrobacterium tumefaciens]MDP9980528.1 hypothetical protein [Agrobacterium tumefaciens]